MFKIKLSYILVLHFFSVAKGKMDRTLDDLITGTLTPDEVPVIQNNPVLKRKRDGMSSGGNIRSAK